MSKLKQFFEKLVEHLTKKNHRGTKRTALTVLAIAIALCTVYALILPAITASATEYELQESDIVTVTLKQQTNNGWVEVPSSAESLDINKNDILRFEMEYELAPGTLTSTRHTVTYQLPSVFSKVTANTISILGTKAVVGEFSITENGLATINFYPTVAVGESLVEQNAALEVGGTIRFDCKAGDIIGDGDGQRISLGEWTIVLEESGGGGGGDTTHETEPTEPPPPEDEDLFVKKTHTVVDAANGIIDFTAVFRADKNSETPPLIYDHMASGMVYVSDFQIREATLDGNDNVVSFGNAVPGTTTVDDQETLVVGNTDFYYQFTNNMVKDQAYAITYRAKVIDPYSGSYHTNNQIKVTTQIDGKKAESGYKDDFYLNNPNTVTKHATISADMSTITWTITVHRHAGSSLENWVLSDILEGYDFTGPAMLSIGGGTATEVTFPYSGFDSNTTETNYVFTYTTPYEPKIGQSGVENVAVFKPSDYTGEHPIRVTETLGTDENNPLKKTDVNVTVDTTDATNPLATIEWNVDITPTLSKLIGGNGYDWLYDDTLKSGQYLTQAQATALENAVVAEMTTKLGFVRGVPGGDNDPYNAEIQKDYTFEVKRSTDATIPTGCFDRFTLHAYKDLAVDQKVNFTYFSTGPIGNLDEIHRFQNRGKVMQNAPGNHVYTVESQPEAVYRPAIVKTDPIPPTGSNVASSNPQTVHDYYKVDGILNWELAVTIPRGIESALTVEDVLPEGVTFDNLVLSVNKKNYSTYPVVWTDETTKTSGTITVGDHGTATVTVDGQTVSVVLPTGVTTHYAGKTDVLYFTLTAPLDEIPSYEGGDSAAPHFANTASVKVPTGDPTVMQTLGSDTQTQVVTVDKYHGVLSKTAVQSAYDQQAGLIPYHLEINPSGADLLDGTDTLILTDTLKAYSQNEGDVTATLDPSSVRVYHRDGTKPGSKGEQLDASRYSYSYRGEWKDHNVIDTITMRIPDACALIVEYTYKIDTKADRLSKKSISNTVKLEGITDGTVGADNTIVVDFESGVTAGVKGIIVYKVDSKNYGMVLPDAQFTLYKYNGTTYETDRIVTTNGDGMTTLTDLTKGTAYKLVETLAPENYILDPTPYYFIVSGGTTVAPSDFAGDLLMEGTAIYRPNTSNYTEINVKKRWQDENGSTVTHDGTVQFNLYRRIGTRDPNVHLTATITKQVKDKDPVTLPFTPQTFQRGDTVEFVVTETRYRPGKDGVPNVTFYVNGDPRVVEPYWDPSQDNNDNATVTYTLTFRIEDDTHIVADLGEFSDENPTVVARLSGTTLPTESRTTGSTSAANYAIRFPNGGSGTIAGTSTAVHNEDRFPQGTQIILTLPQDTPGKHFTGWKIVKSSNTSSDVTSACLASNNVLTMPSYSVNAVALYDEVEVQTYNVYMVDGKQGGDPIVTLIGSAAEGATATVTAGSPAPGWDFDRWLVVDANGDEIANPDIEFDDDTAVRATFTMPNHAVYVTPTYKEKTPYSITVTADTGGVAEYSVDTVANEGYAFKGEVVTLSVPTIPDGKLFNRWVITSPATGLTFDLTDPNATFTMPESNVVINATFKNRPSNIIVNGNFDDGLASWTGNNGSFSVNDDGELVFTFNDVASNDLFPTIADWYNGGKLKAGQTYTLFADVTGGSTNACVVVAQASNGNPIDRITTENGRVTFTTDPNPSTQYIVKIRIREATADTTFSIDDIILVEGEHTTPPSDEPTYNVVIDPTIVGGTVTANKAKAAAGEQVNLTVTPAPGYGAETVYVTRITDGTPVALVSNSFIMPEGGVNVTATFPALSYTVTVVGGTIDGESTATVNINGEVTLDLDESAIPSGKVFDRWQITGGTGSGNCITGEGWQEPNATFKLLTPGNVTLTAQYKDPAYTITNPDGYVTASVNGQAVDEAPSGATVTLTPATRSGYTFKNFVVTDADGHTVTLTELNQFTMPAKNVTVTAVYEEAATASIWSTVSLKNNTNCSLTDGLSSPLSFPIGTDVTFTVMIPKVYQANVKTDAQLIAVAPLTANGVTITPDTIEVGTGVSGNFPVTYTYTVTLNEDTEIDGEIDSKDKGDIVIAVITSGGGGGGDDDGAYNVVVDSNIQHGTVTANPTSADQGDTVTLTITPDEGYTLGTLTVKDSGGNDVTVTSNAFTMPASDVTVTATFAPLAADAFEEIVDRVTLSFYDKLCTRYGITYHSYQTLTNPVIQYVQGSTPASWSGASTVTPTLSATVTGGKMKSLYDPTTFEQAGNAVGATDYVYKGALPALSGGTAYTYRVGGKLPNGEEVWSDPYTFTTKSATASDDLSFIWFSDSHYNTLSNSGVALRKVLNAANSLLPNGPDMILSGGDFTDQGDLLYYAASAIDGNEDYFAQTPFFVASGNHDRKGVASTASHIVNVDLSNGRGGTLDTGPYYSFDYNGVHVVVLNNGDENNSNVSTTMVNWLTTDLANSNAAWKIVMMHKPIYGPVQSGSTESVPEARGQLAGVFAQYGVDAVLQGHVHMYARSKPITNTSGTVATGYTTTTETTGGFTYDVLQSPGAPIYTVMGIAGATGNRTVASTQPAYLEEYASGQPYSFAAWRIDGDKLYVDAGYADASTGEIAGYYDHFAIDKSGGGGGTTTYSVNVTTPTNGTVTANPSSSITAGTQVELTVTPATGYELDTLTVDGVDVTSSVSGGKYTFNMPAKNVAVSATFKQTGGGGGGTNLVTNGDFSNGTNGWSKGGAGAFSVNGSGQATITGGSSSSAGVTQTVTGLTEGNTYRVSFDVISGSPTFILNGTSTTPPIGTYTTTFVANGTTATLVFGSYKSDFVIDNVSLVDTSGGGGGGETTTYSVSAATGLTGGTIASVSPATAAAGATITVTLDPADDYEPDTVTVTKDGGGTVSGVTQSGTDPNVFTFTMPADDVTVSATFTSTGGGGGGGGTNLIVNGDFSNGTTGWTNAATFNVSGGVASVVNGSTNAATFRQAISLIAGHSYTLTADILSTNSKLKLSLVDENTFVRTDVDVGTLTYTFEASGNETMINFGGTKREFTIDNICLIDNDASPSGDASPFEDTGPGDDGPVLDLDGARGNMLGDGEPGTLIGTYTITASNSWELLIENLVSTELVNGQEIFYVYYVEEVAPAGVGFSLVGYQNNGGITSGDITIINTASEEEREHIVLPETGGGGNWPYVVGGATLMTVCLFGGVVMTRRRRKASG